MAVGALTFTVGRAELPETDPLTALNEGNRLFRNGQVQQAVETYGSGYHPASPHPTLLYNLATALHHLDRLPEAILWYRRAAEVGGAPSAEAVGGEVPAAGKGDPWLQENLWLARRSLGSEVLPAGGPLGWLGRHAGALRAAAIVLAWAALLVVIAVPRMPTWGTAVIALLAFSLYGGAIAVDRWGPRAAVVLEDCFTAAGELPAGTEIWVRPATGGGWLISGSDNAVCEAGAVGLVLPDA
ncbi:MAG: tetratricopeptide repeat protein [Thermoanaerobaculia bacterium]